MTKRIVPTLTPDELREVLAYDAETGVFTNKFNRRKARAGQPTGCLNPANGYVYITVNYQRYLAHRLAWMYVHGVWPEGEIDHIDRVRTHNWIGNLREVTSSVNKQNIGNSASVHNKSTNLLGSTVCISARNGRPIGFRARIRVNGRQIELGRFETAQEAHECYLEAKRRLHAGCTI